MARQQHRLSALCITYYRQIDRREIAEERLRLTHERITELAQLLDSNQLMPSQGVARYSPIPCGQGSPSDPTVSVFARYEREFTHYAEERTRLQLRATSLSQEIAEIRDQCAVLTKALSYLTAVDRHILEGKYRFGKSNVQIAIEVELDERTVRNHLDALALTLPVLLERLGTAAELPVISSSDLLPVTLHEITDRDSAIPGQIPLPYE